MSCIKTSIRFPSKKVYNQFKKVAKKEGLSMRQMLEKLIKVVIDKHETKCKRTRKEKVVGQTDQTTLPIVTSQGESETEKQVETKEEATNEEE